jgi:hypothetical protein
MKTKISLIILLALSLVLSACGGKSDLASNREKWDGQKITHYRFNLTIACFCPYYEINPVTVEVQDGQIVSMLDAQGNPLAENYRSAFEQAGTIEALFAVAEENLANADKVEIVYDNTYGFPASIVVDRIKLAVDDEISYYAENFEVLK